MTSRHRTLGTIAVFLGTCMATIAISFVSIALPSVQQELNADMTDLQWVIASYGLAMSSFMLSAGPLGDRFGRRRVWLIGIVVFICGSFMAAMANNLPLLISGCAVQGLAGAIIVPGALSILTQAYPEPEKRSRIIGGWASVTGISLIISPVIGGILVDTFGWHSIFLINVPLGMLTLALGRTGIEESADPDHAALDPAGQLLSVLTLGGLTIGLTEAGRSGWSAPLTLAGLAVAGSSLIVFLIVESRVAKPILPVDLFANRDFACVNLSSFIIGFMGFSSLFFFSLFLQQIQKLSATMTGLHMAPVFLAMTIVSSQFGSIAARFNMMRIMATGFVAMGLAILGMTQCSASSSFLMQLPLFLLLGFGMGLAIPANSAAIMAITPRERSGSAAATLMAMRQSGMTIGIALLGSVMSGTSARELAMGASASEALTTGFHVTMVCGGLTALAIAILLLRNAPKPALASSTD